LGGAVLHHVSSVAVFPYGGGRIRREDEDIADVQTLTSGYAQSKWVAERMVWKAIGRGLRAVIYRPGQIASRAIGGPPHDLFDHIISVCGTLRAVPDIKMKIDMVTPEFVAAAIRSLSVQGSSIGRAFHLVNPEPLRLQDFIGLLPAPLPLIPFEAWQALLEREASQSDDPSLQFVAMLTRGLSLEDVTPPDFDCSGANAELRRAGITCPPLNQSLIRSLRIIK
jgi:thioester reductase-like protein